MTADEITRASLARAKEFGDRFRREYEESRKAWRKGFARACPVLCSLLIGASFASGAWFLGLIAMVLMACILGAIYG